MRSFPRYRRTRYEARHAAEQEARLEQIAARVGAAQAGFEAAAVRFGDAAEAWASAVSKALR